MIAVTNWVRCLHLFELSRKDRLGAERPLGGVHIAWQDAKAEALAYQIMQNKLRKTIYAEQRPLLLRVAAFVCCGLRWVRR
jgi:hypothetical protein